MNSEHLSLTCEMMGELKYYHIIQVRRYTKHLFTDYEITENNTPPRQKTDLPFIRSPLHKGICTIINMRGSPLSVFGHLILTLRITGDLSHKTIWLTMSDLPAVQASFTLSFPARFNEDR